MKLITVWCVFVSSAFLCVENTSAQSELLDNTQDGISVMSGLTHLDRFNTTLTTQMASLSVRGRIDFGIQFTQVYGGPNYRSPFATVHWWKPAPGFPFGSALSLALDSSGQIGSYDASFYWRTEAPGSDQFVAKLVVGITRNSRMVRLTTAEVLGNERLVEDDAFTVGGELIAASSLANGFRIIIAPHYQWQNTLGSTIGVRLGILRFDPDTGKRRKE